MKMVQFLKKMEGLYLFLITIFRKVSNGKCTWSVDSNNFITKFTAYVNIANLAVDGKLKVARSAAVHELGHALGLDHVTGPVDAIMNSGRNREITYVPTQNDKNGVNYLYL